MIYSAIREMCVEGVVRQSTNPPPLDRIRMVFDASFFTVNSTTSEAFAARSSNRDLLRLEKSLTFSAGSAALSSDVLKKYFDDTTLTVSSTPASFYGFRKYPQYIRGGDGRLGSYTLIGESVLATKPTANGGGNLTGAATLTAICSPAEPATEDAEFVAPDDYINDFVPAMIQFILGQIVNEASATA